VYSEERNENNEHPLAAPQLCTWIDHGCSTGPTSRKTAQHMYMNEVAYHKKRTKPVYIYEQHD